MNASVIGPEPRGISPEGQMVIIALLAHTGSGTDLEIYPSKRTYLMAGNLVFATDKAAK